MIVSYETEQSLLVSEYLIPDRKATFELANSNTNDTKFE